MPCRVVQRPKKQPRTPIPGVRATRFEGWGRLVNRPHDSRGGAYARRRWRLEVDAHAGLPLAGARELEQSLG